MQEVPSLPYGMLSSGVALFNVGTSHHLFNNSKKNARIADTLLHGHRTLTLETCVHLHVNLHKLVASLKASATNGAGA